MRPNWSCPRLSRFVFTLAMWAAVSVALAAPGASAFEFTSFGAASFCGNPGPVGILGFRCLGLGATFTGDGGLGPYSDVLASGGFFAEFSASNIPEDFSGDHASYTISASGSVNSGIASLGLIFATDEAVSITATAPSGTLGLRDISSDPPVDIDLGAVGSYTVSAGHLYYLLFVGAGEGTFDIIVTFSDISGPADSDGDGVPDDQDICPGFDDNVDTDGDGFP